MRRLRGAETRRSRRGPARCGRRAPRAGARRTPRRRRRRRPRSRSRRGRRRSRRRSRARARRRPGRARGRPRRARSARTARRGRRRQAGAVVADLEPHVVARRRATPTSIGVPAGVWTSALRSRLASTWRSWWASPTTTVVGRRARADRRGRARSRARRRRRRARAGEVDLAVRRVGDLVEPRQRQQVLDEHAHARRLVLDPAHRLLDVLPARAPRPCGTARRSRGSRRAACAARARRRRGSGAGGPRWPRARRTRSSSRSSIALSAMPERARPRCAGRSTSTRCERSPPAIAPAVWPMRSSGSSPTRTSDPRRRPPSTSSTPAITSASTSSRRSSVWSTSRSGTAATIDRAAARGCGSASTR